MKFGTMLPPMKILYFDAFSGASGDMILAALSDASGSFPRLATAMRRLSARRFELRRRRVRKASLSAVKIDVRLTAKDDLDERNLAEITEVIQRSGLSEPVRKRAIAIVRRLCEAEAAAHGLPLARVHLHEAGAIDAIADICGAAWLIDEIAPDRIVCSPINVGSGTIDCRHGTYPVPGPATARLIRGVPVYDEGAPGERLTPTGAAILTTIADAFGPMPAMTVRAVGVGAGDRSDPDRPNVLRAFVGDTGAPAETGAGRANGDPPEVVVLEATIDDMNPQNYGYLMDRALAAGALEIYYTPVFMKKDRPGTQVTIIADQKDLDALGALLFRETTTIGFRHRRESRRELARAIRTVKTRFGPVRVKESSHDGAVVQVQPEFEDCRKLAQSRKVPLKEVQRAALAAWKPGRAR